MTLNSPSILIKRKLKIKILCHISRINVVSQWKLQSWTYFGTLQHLKKIKFTTTKAILDT